VLLIRWNVFFSMRHYLRLATARGLHGMPFSMPLTQGGLAINWAPRSAEQWSGPSGIVRIEEEDIPAYQQHLADQAVGVTMNDVYALQRNAPLLRSVVPEMRLRDAMVTRGSKTYGSWWFSAPGRALSHEPAHRPNTAAVQRSGR